MGLPLSYLATLLGFNIRTYIHNLIHILSYIIVYTYFRDGCQVIVVEKPLVNFTLNHCAKYLCTLLLLFLMKLFHFIKVCLLFLLLPTIVIDLFLLLPTNNAINPLSLMLPMMKLNKVATWNVRELVETRNNPEPKTFNVF